MWNNLTPKNMKSSNYIFLSLFMAFFVWQCSPKSSVKQFSNGVQLLSGDMNVKVQFYADNTVRILKWNASGKEEKHSLSVIMSSDSTVKVDIQAVSYTHLRAHETR